MNDEPTWQKEAMVRLLARVFNQLFVFMDQASAFVMVEALLSRRPEGKAMVNELPLDEQLRVREIFKEMHLAARELDRMHRN